MPLLDHFHPPLVTEDSWESFHTYWAVCLGDYLNRLLPRRYRALVQTHLGSQVEADVAEFEQAGATLGNGSAGGVALKTYAPPAVALTMPAVYPDDMEVQVVDSLGRSRLAAVIELVSPGNKDRPEKRRAFAARCAAYLERGIGLVVLDTVTVHRFHLHNELMRLLNLGAPFLLSEEQFLSAVASRPARREQRNEIDVWPSPLTVGEVLPLVPLALRGAAAVPLDLEATYTQARERSRI